MFIMIRTTLIITGLLVTGTAAAATGMVGIADSSADYILQREASLLKTPGQTMTTLQAGDRVAAMRSPVKVQTLTGDVVIVGQGSQATFTGGSAVELHEGTVIMTTGPRSENAAIVYRDLTITPAIASSVEPGAEQALVAVNAKGDSVRVTSGGTPFSVLTEDGTELAVVDSNTPLNLMKDDNDAWAQGVTVATIPDLQDHRPYVLQQQQQGQAADPSNRTLPPETGGVNRSDGNGSFATGALVGGITGLAIGAGSVYLYKDYQDDKDDDDDDGDKQFERPCVSPLFRRR
jgi:hypothetical protein